MQQQKVSAEQKAYDRKVSKIRLNTQLKQWGREIDYKQKQIATEIITETRTIHKLPDGTTTIVDGFTDGLKPKHIIENELDQLKAMIEMNKEQLAEIEKAEEEENAKSEGSNS